MANVSRWAGPGCLKTVTSKGAPLLFYPGDELPAGTLAPDRFKLFSEEGKIVTGRWVMDNGMRFWEGIEITESPPTELERAESLERLRETYDFLNVERNRNTLDGFNSAKVAAGGNAL